jgi:gluconate 5-dehydrogenase
MVPEEEVPPGMREALLEPAVMGPPVVWLASPAAAQVHDERIVAVDFAQWLARRSS